MIPFTCKKKFLIRLNFIGSNISNDCFGQFIHLFTSLAGGRVAVIFEGNQVALPSTVDSVEICTKALLGDPISWCGIRRQMDLTSVGRIRTVIRALRPYWSAFQFDVQLPDNNVLVPPWVNDSKILENNPELQKL